MSPPPFTIPVCRKQICWKNGHHLSVSGDCELGFVTAGFLLTMFSRCLQSSSTAEKGNQIKPNQWDKRHFLGGNARIFFHQECLFAYIWLMFITTPNVNSLYIYMTSGRILNVSETRHSLKYVHQFSHTDHPPRKKTERSRENCPTEISRFA